MFLKDKYLLDEGRKVTMRAIILAAGMGTRLRPLTDDKPKSLVEVMGEPMIERQIRFLKEKGIDDIIVLTGYMAEKFDYLKERYGVKLIHNDKYDVYNNIYTIYLVREYLKDSYVTEADVYMSRNYFDENLNKSSYFVGIKNDFENEWIMNFDKEDRLYNIKVGSGTDYILAGASYWTENDGEVIKNKLEEVIENGGDFSKMYWDEVVAMCLKDIDVRVKKIDSNDWFEIDSVEDLEAAEDFFGKKDEK